MTPASTALLRWRAATIACAALLVALAVGGVTQHLRHGWPFSLHHGYAPAGTHAAHRAATTASVDAARRVTVRLDPSGAESIGVTLATARREEVGHPFRVTATVAPDESRVSHVHTRVAGWIQRFDVNVTGQRVRAGQTLATIFSQELLASQNELLSVLRAQRTGASPALASAQQGLIEGARSRLRVLGMTDAEVASVERSGVARRDVSVLAPRDGVVLHRGVSVGAAVDPSTELVTVADLSRVWVFLEVPEAEIPNVAVGSPFTLSLPAAGDAPREGVIEFLAPTLTEQTRTLRARASLANPDGALRPGTYGTAEVRSGARQALVVPRDAVVDTGVSQHVFVVTAPDTYEPRAVTLGSRLGDRVELREGLHEGERVVASGVFLLDSESRLRASGGAGTGHAGHGGSSHGAAPAAAPPTEAPTPPEPGGHAAHAGHGG